MYLQKSASILLIALLGFPKISLAMETTTHGIPSINTDLTSVQLTEDEFLLSQRDGRRRSRPRPNRPIRRERRRERRREFRNDIRDGIRRERNRRTAGRIIRGVVGIGVGAAIAESNRRNRQNTETVIIERGNDLEDRRYYDELYKCEHLNQGGYYNADELERCLR